MQVTILRWKIFLHDERPQRAQTSPKKHNIRLMIFFLVMHQKLIRPKKIYCEVSQLIHASYLNLEILLFMMSWIYGRYFDVKSSELIICKNPMLDYEPRRKWFGSKNSVAHARAYNSHIFILSCVSNFSKLSTLKLKFTYITAKKV